jgi:hypothetical protein
MVGRFGIAILDAIFPFRGEICARIRKDGASSNSNIAGLPINGLIASKRDYDIDYRASTVALLS